jgi:hypothetical protein
MDGSPSLRRRHRTATKNSWAGFLHHKAAGVLLRTEPLSIAETSQITNHSFAEWYRSNSDAQGVVLNVSKAQNADIARPSAANEFL